MAHGDAREGKWRGKWRMEWVASTLHTTSEHGVSSITTTDAHTLAASSRLNWRPRRFKSTRPFRRKTKSGFCACAITVQLAATHFLMCSLPSEHHNNFMQRICIWKTLLTPASPLSGPHRCTWSWNVLNLCSSIQCDSIFHTSAEQYEIIGFCVALQCFWISRATQSKSSMLYVQRFFYPCQIEEEWTCVWYSCVRASLI